MKNFFLIPSVLVFSFISVFAQIKKEKIAIFAPLYLDSAFDNLNEYRYGKQFPKFINPGLEFYEGVQLALDSLNKEGAQLEVFVYDTRSSNQTLAQQLENSQMKDLEMIIAYTSPQESWSIASEAKKRKTPYINVNLPNDAGITNNPYFVMMNSTLRTHIEHIYKYVQKNYPLSTVIVFRKKGQMEDVIKSDFYENTKSTLSVPLKIKYVDLTDSFSVDQLAPRLDSTEHTVIIAGSLDDNFGKRLGMQLASLSKEYSVTLMGMPTFDNLAKEFTRPEYKGIEIIYGTPFYNAGTDKISQHIINYFNTQMYARPSDMVMRGYEAMWRFSKLLMKYGKDVSSSLTRKEFNIFREFDIQPVINKQNNTLDYFENKKLFFVKMRDGIIKSVN
jgi:hypothetical protein